MAAESLPPRALSSLLRGPFVPQSYDLCWLTLCLRYCWPLSLGSPSALRSLGASASPGRTSATRVLEHCMCTIAARGSFWLVSTPSRQESLAALRGYRVQSRVAHASLSSCTLALALPVCKTLLACSGLIPLLDFLFSSSTVQPESH